jgi:hypothetical protein
MKNEGYEVWVFMGLTLSSSHPFYARFRRVEVLVGRGPRGVYMT